MKKPSTQHNKQGCLVLLPLTKNVLGLLNIVPLDTGDLFVHSKAVGALSLTLTSI
jgi:hypothetical protein